MVSIFWATLYVSNPLWERVSSPWLPRNPNTRQA